VVLVTRVPYHFLVHYQTFQVESSSRQPSLPMSEESVFSQDNLLSQSEGSPANSQPCQSGPSSVNAPDVSASHTRSSKRLQRSSTAGSQGRNWCITLNSPTEEELLKLRSTFPKLAGLRYFVFQTEQSGTGTRHVQGYLEWKTPIRLQRLKLLISPRVHLEMRKGTATQAAAYCKKSETRLDGPYEFGTMGRCAQGRRNDLARLKKAITDGLSDRQLWEECFEGMAKHHRAMDKYRFVLQEQRTTKTQTIVLFGTPGTGKSHWCRETYPDAYWKQRSNWWDGLGLAPTVVMDDFYGWLPFDQLLRLCDKYPLMVETKGSQSHFFATTICITSNTLPSTWYKNVPNFAAFIRRVDKWMIFDKSMNLGEFTEFDNYDDFLNKVNQLGLNEINGNN